jgi:hypothetical protein
VTYQFYRQPIRSAVAPLVLPASVAIDLQASGTDSSPAYFSPASNDFNTNQRPSAVILMFSPAGSLDRVYFSRATASRGYEVIREPVFLLVGRGDRIMVTQDVTTTTRPEEYPNWFDPASLWLTISPQTAIASAKENYSVSLNPTSNGRFTNGIFLARSLARQAQTIGGR